MKNAQMEAIARDYSELHIDITGTGAGAEIDAIEPADTTSPESPTTFMSMTTPKAKSSSARKKGKKGFFKRIFGARKRKEQTASPKRDATQSDIE